MRKMINGWVAGLATLAVVAVAPSPSGAEQVLPQHLSGVPTGKYIFVLRDDATGDIGGRARAAAQQGGARLGRVFTGSLRGFSLETSKAGADRIARTMPGLAFVEPDVTVSIYDSFTPRNTPMPQQGWKGQVTPWGVARVGACLTGSCDVPKAVGTPWVWVIDTGIADHPDLNVNRSFAYSAVGGTGYDGLGHGTHVSGTIAAKNDGKGVVGVAPGAVVVPVQVISQDNGGSIETIIAGIEYVARQRQNCRNTIGCEPQKWVANMSLTTPGSRALDLAVLRASQLGVRIAIAAGNQAQQARNYSPARVNANNILTVSASCGPVTPECEAGKDAITSFSNYGTPPIDYAAPGDEVLSTWLDGGYLAGAGTSMASPHVAGLLARLPDLTRDGVGTHFCGRLTRDRDRSPDPIAFLYGPGDARCALALSKPADPPPPMNVPR